MNKRNENLRHSWEKPLAHTHKPNFLFALLKRQIAFLDFVQGLFIHLFIFYHVFFNRFERKKPTRLNVIILKTNGRFTPVRKVSILNPGKVFSTMKLIFMKKKSTQTLQKKCSIGFRLKNPT